VGAVVQAALDEAVDAPDVSLVELVERFSLTRTDAQDQLLVTDMTRGGTRPCRHPILQFPVSDRLPGRHPPVGRPSCFCAWEESGIGEYKSVELFSWDQKIPWIPEGMGERGAIRLLAVAVLELRPLLGREVEVGRGQPRSEPSRASAIGLGRIAGADRLEQRSDAAAVFDEAQCDELECCTGGRARGRERGGPELRREQHGGDI